LVSLYSIIKMMHGPINIRYPKHNVTSIQEVPKVSLEFVKTNYHNEIITGLITCQS